MYRELYEKGEFERGVERGYRILEECSLCPRQYRVNRLKGEKGFCQAGKLPLVSNFGPHFGEEVPLVGRRGSGTIFLTRCYLACQFCQNYHISQLGQGQEISLEELAQQMLSLERQGCHNINFVSPTHFIKIGVIPRPSGRGCKPLCRRQRNCLAISQSYSIMYTWLSKAQDMQYTI